MLSLTVEARGMTRLGDNRVVREHPGQLTSRDVRARITLLAVCHFLSLPLQKGPFMWFLGGKLKWSSVQQTH